MRHLWLTVFVLAACGGSSKPAVTPGAGDKPVGPSCAQVSDQIIVLGSTGAKDAPTDAIDHMRIKLTRQCEDTAWSLAARQCVLDAKTAAETNACEPLFTDAQRAAWDPGTPQDTPAPSATPEGAERPDLGAPPRVEPAAPSKGAAPPLPKAPETRSRAKAPGAASDPCDGGE